MPEALPDDASAWDGIVLDQAAVLHQGCTDCGICLIQCAFLSRYGTPKQICAEVKPGAAATTEMAYRCSLCGLCSTVCPEKLDPCAWFLSLRRAAVSGGRTDLSSYRTIIGYEKTGTSSLFSFYAFPEGCDTVFFPGCTLPGTRPDTTWLLFQHLRSRLPTLGIVLDCCSKPSHDLGRQEHFLAMFREMVDLLKAGGITSVWTACPNCYRIFNDYEPELETRSVYEVVDGLGLPDGENPRALRAVDSGRELVVHDPCPMRAEAAVHESVRSLLAKLNIRTGRIAFRRRKTLCCGEGGAVGFVAPELAASWTAARKKSAKGRIIVTYCAGCTGFLNRVTPAVHLADLLFDTEKTLAGKRRPAKAPFTYLYRLLLKRKLKKTMHPAITRVRRYLY